MPTAPHGPHADTLEAAVPHFNSAFRRRYRLPAVTLEALQADDGLAEAFEDVATLRAG